MKFISLFFLALATCFLAACVTQHPPVSETRLPFYHLTVTFPSGATIKTAAFPSSTFNGTTIERNGSAYAIGGAVFPAEGSTIPMILTVAETKPEATQNSIVSFTFQTVVPLGQPTNIGAGSGICTVQLDP
jgi:hypothetical protein